MLSQECPGGRMVMAAAAGPAEDLLENTTETFCVNFHTLMTVEMDTIIARDSRVTIDVHARFTRGKRVGSNHYFIFYISFFQALL
jgi:hypothetical protein